jgi:transcriptional regulator with XRE-family HTH domain
MQNERTKRGWSQCELARQMTANGYLFHQSSIWHIENGQPPRHVTVGELVVMARLFGMTLQEMVQMPLPDDEWKLLPPMFPLAVRV